MLTLAECWEPRFFFIEDFTPVNICCSLDGRMENQRECQYQKKSQVSAEQNLPK